MQSGSEEFWCNVMWGKYNRNSNNISMIAKASDSHLWKSIVNLWPKIELYSVWEIGNGTAVNWYQDAWIEKGMRLADMNFNIPDAMHDVKVAQLVEDDGNWKWRMLAEWLPANILNKIAAIPPPQVSDGADYRSCMEDAGGKFSISDMYHALCNFEDDANDEIWKLIWRLKVPERVRMFVWLMQHERLLTNFQKSKMGLGSAMCDYCGDQVEDIVHVMRDCPLVMPLWLNIVQANMRGTFFSGNTKQWINFNMRVCMGGHMDVEWQNLWATACHFLWIWRNDEKHNNHFIRPRAPAMVVMQRTRNYMIADKALCTNSDVRKEEKFIRWESPPAGWVRLNTDGSCHDSGHIGCGGIIRGSDGEWLGGFAKFIGQGNAYVAELWGVLEGLKYAKRLNFQRVELHIDSMVVVKAITSKGGGITSGRSLVAKIHRLIDLDWEIVVKHSYREANQCADALANIGSNMTYGCAFFDTCPINIRHIFLADVMGIATPRLIHL